MTRRSSRRDFLRGRSAAQAMADAVQGALPGGELSCGLVCPVSESYVLRISREAMACEFEIRFNPDRYGHGTETALKALDRVEALESQLSVFRPDSEICRINQTADAEAVEVEPRLFELIETAMRLNEETDGAYDLTSGPLWEAWGFACRAGAVPDARSLDDALQRVGSRHVELDPDKKTIRFLRSGVQLNLGSVGKGYALDRCCEILREGGIEDFLIHGGHSSVLASGGAAAAWDTAPQAGKPQEFKYWSVGLLHPLRPNQRLAEIRLSDRALATSGCWAQSFVHQGHRYGHILDPRTGWPAEDILSATVVAPTGALADALSTAFFVMGPEPMLDYCRKRPEIGAVLALPVRHSGGIEIETIGLTEDELVFL